MREGNVVLGVVVTFLLTSSAAWAHHAFAAEYDEAKHFTVSGSVTAFKWSNPHAWVYVDSQVNAGQVTHWSFEMGSPNGLIHRGWKRGELRRGDSITVEAFRAKDGSNKGNAGTITLPDGRKLFGGFQSTPRGPSK